MDAAVAPSEIEEERNVDEEPYITELTDDPEVLKSMVDMLKLREQELRKEKEQIEQEFGMKRARFMELFKQKEGEVAIEKELCVGLQAERDELAVRVRELQMEVDECKSQVTVMECTKENEVDEHRRRCQSEIASLQQIIKETINESGRQKQEYEREIKKLKRMLEKLESEHQEQPKGQQSTSSSPFGAASILESKEGVLSVVTKTLAKRVPGLTAYSQSTENIAENLEDSMKKAQEDAEVLRSLVVPLEEEIKALKEKLRAADDTIRSHESSALKALESSTESSDRKSLLDISSNDLDEKLKGLHEGLQAEKSSRSDLEMYVAVLQSQKATLQNEVEDLRKQLGEVCQLLDKEKREHSELKQTWQMANNHFLEVQRVQADDMKRMQCILTAEQQKTFAELRKDVKEPLTSFNLEGIDSSKRSSPISFPSSPRRQKSPSPAKLSTVEKSADDGNSRNEFLFEGKVLYESVSSSESTEDQVKSAMETISDESRLSEVVPGQSDLSLRGKTLVPEKEWLALQEELKLAKEKIKGPCDMCSNYEVQLQKAQDREKEQQKRIKALEQSNEWHKSDLQNEQQARKELEDKLTKSSTDMQKEMTDLYLKMGEMEKIHEEIRLQYLIHVQEVSGNMKELTANREEVQERLTKLQHENDALIGKYSSNSQQMQNEEINLPSSPEDMQLLLLRLREDLIIAKTAKEHLEETLRSEILFMKESAKVEQHSRDETERMLTQEIDSLREKVGILESVKLQYEREQNRRTEAEKALKEWQQKYTDSQAKHKQLVSALQKQVEEASKMKKKLEEDVNHMRSKVQTLQGDLVNSEAVQRDFVKLSQSLQVQIEKIRESESEVRWQHEEDVDDCSNCKQPFTVTRRRHHCRHCGKIFCADCTSKWVQSGPNQRQSKVCDVCHTLLVRNAAPYFSTEPPHTID